MSKRYHNCIPIPAEQMESLLGAAVTKSAPYYDVVNVDKKTTARIKKLLQPDPDRLQEAQGAKPVGPSRAGACSKKSAGGIAPDGAAAEPQLGILMSGLEEIKDVLKGHYNLSDVLYMILETMYRGFELNRVIFCLRDLARGMMVARFGLGENADDIVRNFHFPLKRSPNIFNIVIAQDKGVLIEDAAAPNTLRNLPEWYRDLMTAPSFLIYPLVTAEGCIGMFYADKRSRGTMLTDLQKNLMEELRDMAIQVITQKQKQA